MIYNGTINKLCSDFSSVENYCITVSSAQFLRLEMSSRVLFTCRKAWIKQ